MISYQFIHFRTILRFAGIVTLLIALLMLISGMYSLLIGESVYMSFAYSSALAFGFGLVLYIAGDRNKSEINKRDGFLTIFITWGSVALVGSLPFFLSGSTNSYGDALFESIAGFSTNGLSLLDFNHTPASIVLWRGIIEWVGGIGIIIFIISFIPFFRSGQARVFFFDRNDETLGKITSSISGTARRLMLIYTGFTIVLLTILLALGLNLHDALLYTFSTMSTSGFSPINGEVSHLSDAVLITISVFMFVAGSNLYLSYHLLKLRMKKIISNDEFRWYVLSIFIPLIFLMGQYFATEGFSGWHDTFPTTFNIVSIITTTGFYIEQNIPVYNHFWWIMLFLLMFLGSAAASSGGGSTCSGR